MLLYADGRRVGAISPGCLEADVMERVPDIAAGGPPQTVEYDMRDADDWAWGETVGCGGKNHGAAGIGGRKARRRADRAAVAIAARRSVLLGAAAAIEGRPVCIHERHWCGGRAGRAWQARGIGNAGAAGRVEGAGNVGNAGSAGCEPGVRSGSGKFRGGGDRLGRRWLPLAVRTEAAFAYIRRGCGCRAARCAGCCVRVSRRRGRLAGIALLPGAFSRLWDVRRLAGGGGRAARRKRIGLRCGDEPSSGPRPSMLAGVVAAGCPLRRSARLEGADPAVAGRNEPAAMAALAYRAGHRGGRAAGDRRQRRGGVDCRAQAGRYTRGKGKCA